MAEINFPSSPTTGQLFTAPTGVQYVFDGLTWTIGFYDSANQTLNNIGSLINQVRTLLQDTDNEAGQYRYSTDSIIANFNQAMMDMYRMRPDLFLVNGFVIPIFSVEYPQASVVIEPQYIPALIYYVVGLTQARDDEQNQDARAMGFLKVFQQTIVNGGLA